MMFEPMLSKSQRSFGGKILCRRPNTNDKRGREWSLFKKFFVLYLSKPLSYAIALNELGSDVVHEYIGQEPSGRKFNDLDLDYNS